MPKQCVLKYRDGSALPGNYSIWFNNKMLSQSHNHSSYILRGVFYILVLYLKSGTSESLFLSKHFSGLFESTCGFSECHGLLTMLSAGLHVSKLFINEKSGVCFLVGICCSTCVHVYE